MNESIFSIPIPLILSSLLVFLRISCILFVLPIFGDNVVPVRVRLLLALATTYIMLPIIPYRWDPTSLTSIFQLLLIVFRELLIGLSIGYVSKLIFDAIIMSASLVGYQMGFGTAELLMPEIGQSVNSFTLFHRIVFVLIFLSLDLHHIYIKAILETFKYIKPGEALPSALLADEFIRASGMVFATAIELAAPILIALLFTMTALGLLARTVPQINVFVLSFPLGFAIGLIVYVATIPLFPSWMGSRFNDSAEMIMKTIYGLASR